jgi:hypothetical protein
MGRRAPALVATAVLLAWSAAAGAATAPGVARYRAQANAICASDSKQLSRLPSGLTLAAYIGDALKITRASYASLSRLSPPASLAALHRRVLATEKAGFPVVERLLAKAKAGKLTVTRFEDDKGLNASAAAETKLWKQIGARVCAS